MNKTAAILGATGLVGNEILKRLLADDRYAKVIVYSRRELELSHAKLKVIVGDLTDEKTFAPAIEADEIFCAIGTTQAKTPDLASYKNIDYGIPVSAANYGIKGGLKRFLVVSSLGAKASSKMFYPRIKGMMEESLLKKAIPQLYIFRPSFILGDRDERRIGEGIAKFLVKALRPIIPRNYRGVEASEIAQAMINAANSKRSETIIQSKEIKALAGD